MNYMKIYNDLVQHAKLKNLQRKDQYIERHHIIMKSLGGLDNDENLVAFTARQHYIAHLLLFKHYKQEMLNGKDKTPYYKCLGALSAMIQLPATKDENGAAKRIFKFGSHLYNSWKIELSKIQSINAKKQIAQLKLNPIKYKQHCDKISTGMKSYIQQNGAIWTGKHHTDETKIKIKESRYDGHGKNNSMSGMVWISNEQLRISINIPNEMLYDYIAEGWIKHRVVDWNKFFIQKKVDSQNLLKRFRQIDEIQLYKQNKIEEIAQKRKDTAEKLRRKIQLLNEMYEFYAKYGFKALVEKYDYRYSKPNFVQQCQKYVESFIPQNGKKRKQ